MKTNWELFELPENFKENPKDFLPIKSVETFKDAYTGLNGLKNSEKENLFIKASGNNPEPISYNLASIFALELGWINKLDFEYDCILTINLEEKARTETLKEAMKLLFKHVSDLLDTNKMSYQALETACFIEINDKEENTFGPLFFYDCKDISLENKLINNKGEWLD